MNQKNVILGAGAILIIIGGLWIFGSKPTPNTILPSAPATTNVNLTQPPVTDAPKTFTLEDIAKHNSKESCYTTIHGSVYDLTTWIDEHPGGPENILQICGKDGSNLFDQKHGGKSKPEQTLSTFKIGSLQ
ncbi:MAG: cytochrome b5-like heme/steroid binding domain-containing protein [Patescibacteria group bacterium]